MVGEIIVLQHDKIGITNNALGLAGVIAERLNATICIRKIKLRSHKLLPVLRSLTNDFETDRCKKMLRNFAFFFSDEDGKGLPKNPICIIGTQANREVPCVFLSRALDCQSVFLGPIERLSESHFDLIIDHEGSQQAASKAIIIPIIPSAIRLRDFSGLSRPGCLIVIGGPIKHQRDNISLWTKLVDKGHEISVATDKPLAITTSPRTGERIEQLIEDHIVQRKIVARPFVRYGAGDRASMKELLAHANLIIVSADSATMISEAIASGAHVIAAFYKSLQGSDKSRAFAECQAKAGRITLWDIDSPLPLPLSQTNALEKCWSDTLWDKIQFCLNDQVTDASRVANITK